MKTRGQLFWKNRRRRGGVGYIIYTGVKHAGRSLPRESIEVN